MTGHDECNEASYSKDQGRHDKNPCHQKVSVSLEYLGVYHHCLSEDRVCCICKEW